MPLQLLAGTQSEPTRHITVLAIANRLGANQALGDIVERVARVWRVSGWYAGLI
jgi:hypothetical protein